MKLWISSQSKQTSSFKSFFVCTHCANYVIIKIIFSSSHSRLVYTFDYQSSHRDRILQMIFGNVAISLQHLRGECLVSGSYMVCCFSNFHDIQRHIRRTIPIDRICFTLVGEFIKRIKFLNKTLSLIQLDRYRQSMFAFSLGRFQMGECEAKIKIDAVSDFIIKFGTVILASQQFTE